MNEVRLAALEALHGGRQLRFRTVAAVCMRHHAHTDQQQCDRRKCDRPGRRRLFPAQKRGGGPVRVSQRR